MRLGLVFAVVAAGCGFEDASKARRPSVASEAPRDALVQADQRAALDAPVTGERAAGKEVTRRIIYDATLDFVVEDFTDVPQKVEALAAKFGAHIADGQLHGHAGAPRSGHFKLRVPVDRFHDFLSSARSLGELRSERMQSEDVTDKYFDLDARLRNKKKQETRLIQLLEENTGKLEEVLKLETEIARVREEVERFEGQLRLLENLSALSTATLKFQEIKGYVPEIAPDFTTRVGRSWQASLTSLRTAGEEVAVGAVYTGPWLAVLSVPVIMGYALSRRFSRRRR
jgi:hypothetical protein